MLADRLLQAAGASKNCTPAASAFAVNQIEMTKTQNEKRDSFGANLSVSSRKYAQFG